MFAANVVRPMWLLSLHLPIPTTTYRSLGGRKFPVLSAAAHCGANALGAPVYNISAANVGTDEAIFPLLKNKLLADFVKLYSKPTSPLPLPSHTFVGSITSPLARQTPSGLMTLFPFLGLAGSITNNLCRSDGML
ncbi:hypothetical protein HYPSUDRAFT_63779 [Hypholoma sublateritium FD-334 SS-4]|uniref:Uncharacterized protein n=1 Tax=Hypholoma sublateritium (strain FD-334 SS-4) TaxID=945553 RepID=A0A0D2Q4I7_HYPSF|nr:hypothetical protein HYPSUDRAFT_63779 [Hypholoma sublateritium FD-334 SS-4]